MPTKNPKVDLRLKYRRVFEIGLILALFILIGAFKYFPTIEKGTIIQDPPVFPIEVIDIPPTGGIPEPPPPPKPPIPILTPSDIELDNIIIENTDLDPDAFVSSINVLKIDDTYNDIEIPYEFADEMPEIIGGLQALQKNVKYPEMARRAGISGRVFLQAIIDKLGNAEKVVVIEGIGFGCDEAAIDAVMKTKFKPAIQRGREVKVKMSIPIVFALQ